MYNVHLNFQGLSMIIRIFGSGYVGLTTGLCFSAFNHSLQFVEIDPKKIKKIEVGELPIFEKGLDHYLKEESNEEVLKQNHIFLNTKKLLIFVS